MRKNQRKHKSIRGTVILLASLLTFAVFILSVAGRTEFSIPHKLALEVVGTLQRISTAVVDFGAGCWQNYVALWDVREENARLREELAKQQEINNRYREAAATNIRLTTLLQFKEKLPQPTVTATVIGRDPSLWFKTVIVDRGSSDGVKPGMPAVTPEGFAGQVIDTSPHYSKIMLAIDTSSAVDVLDQATRVQGIIKGTGAGYALYYVLKNADINENDRLITSGLDGSFPKGIAVGTVASVVKKKRGMFQQITVTPTVDFSRLERLLIMLTEPIEEL